MAINPFKGSGSGGNKRILKTLLIPILSLALLLSVYFFWLQPLFERPERRAVIDPTDFRVKDYDFEEIASLMEEEQLFLYREIHSDPFQPPSSIITEEIVEEEELKQPEDPDISLVTEELEEDVPEEVQVQKRELQFVLRGVVGDQRRRIAIVEGVEDVYIKEQGDFFNGLRVLEVGPDYIRLEDENAFHYTLDLWGDIDAEG